MFFSRKKVPKSDASVLFIFIAAVGTLILATAILRLGSVKRIVVDERSVPQVINQQITDALPRDVVGAVNKLEIQSATETTTVVVYQRQDQQMLGLIQWDQLAEKYVVRHQINLRSDSNQSGLPDISAVSYGWGTQPLIELRWELMNNDTEEVSFVQMNGVRLRQVLVEGAKRGRVGDFVSGRTGSGQSEININDYDGDGVFELVVTTTSESGDISIDVFLWGGDRLFWSDYWSRVLEAQVGLFPKPSE